MKTLIKNFKKCSAKIIVSENVESMIRLLCSEFKNKEWSGILFYTYEGSLIDNNLKIFCKDICLMDIGNSGYTEFVESPDIISYQVNHNLLDCQTGLVHSHHSMATFFSNVDLDTLEKEGSHMNNFVSLIVNNKGDYTAAITQKIVEEKKVKSNKSCKFFGENSVDLGYSEYLETEEIIEYTPLEIEIQRSSNNELLERISEIQKNKTVSVNTNYSLSVPNKDFSTPVYKASTLFEQPYSFENKVVKIDDDVMRTAVLNIITGSILIDDKNLDISSWIPKMESLYKKRFKNIDDFRYWADGHVDGVLQTLGDGITQSDECMEELVTEIEKKLRPYKNSIYIEEFIDCLDKYLM